MTAWEAALPSRVKVNLPADATELIEKARRIHTRFGQYHDALQPLRGRIEREPVERAEIEQVLSRQGMPGDFDAAMLCWKPDFEEFYLCRVKESRPAHFVVWWVISSSGHTR